MIFKTFPKRIILLYISLTLITLACNPGKNTEKEQTAELNYKAHLFYYNWYGNPETDSIYYHWAHRIMKQFPDDSVSAGFPGGDDIGANYYPQLGCYSSNDSLTIDRHMQMISNAGTGVIVLTWWGAGSYEDKNVGLIMNTAGQYNIKVCFHIEPFPGRSPETVKEAAYYLMEHYGEHPSLYRTGNKNLPVFYVYDSYLIPDTAWAALLSDKGRITVRNTSLDAIFIGLWVTESDSSFFLNSGFDGFYTYFASEGFTYGSTTGNWEKLSVFAKKHDLIFVPCAGPGYFDTRIRPWNAVNTKSREAGAYYDRMFETAIEVKPDYIGITSFNEWHEGTQIEPAIPKIYREFSYENYAPMEPDYYLERTGYWCRKF